MLIILTLFLFLIIVKAFLEPGASQLCEDDVHRKDQNI